MFAGMKVAISLALVGAIAGEFVASQVGLGYAILTAQGMIQTTACSLPSSCSACSARRCSIWSNLIERLVVPWHVSQRGGAGGH